jgi:peptidyl-prolyl cis-trans isomerase D
MFDLFRSREKTVRYLLGGLLTLVAISMVVTLAPLPGVGPAMDEQVIAEIGDEVLTAAEVRRGISREMQNRAFPPELAEMYVPVFVQNMVNERAVAYQAKRMGFTVTEDEVSNAIQSLFPQLFEGGKFAGRQAYEQVLSQMNVSMAQFEDLVKKQILVTRLEVLAIEGVVVTPGQVEEEFRRKNEKIALSYVSLSPANFRAQVKADDAEIAAHYEKNKPTYRVSEKRNYTIFSIDEARTAQSIQVPEAELKRAYASSADRFRTPERVRVRHILLKTGEKPKEEVAKIRARAEDLLKQLKNGAKFEELAQKHSEDPTSAEKGGDLDWVTREQTVPEFEKTAFSLKVGETSELVTTVFGFHLIRVDAKETARQKSFEEVKAELAQETTKQLIYDRMQTLADQIHAALLKSPAEAETLARQNGVTVATAERVAAGDPVPEAGASPEFREAVAPLAKGGVTPVISIAGNRLVIARVTDILEARQAELAEVKEEIRAQLLTEKAQNLAGQKVKEAATRLQALNGDLAALAREMKLEVKTTKSFSREGAADGIGAAGQVGEGFNKNLGEWFGPVNTGSGFFFCKVTEKIPADLTQMALQRDTLLQSIKGNRARQRRELFMEGIVAQLIKDKKLKINDEAIKRLTASYRG